MSIEGRDIMKEEGKITLFLRSKTFCRLKKIHDGKRKNMGRKKTTIKEKNDAEVNMRPFKSTLNQPLNQPACCLLNQDVVLQTL